MTYDEKVLNCFLENQTKLFPKAVAETVEEADEFLGECLAVVCDSLDDVWDFFLEEGLDTDEYDKKTIAEADEVFEIGDGRYLIVES